MNQTKIKRWHLERLAFVYLRQSSPTQVKKNVESAERQRRMQQRAQELGWPDLQVQLLGGDTGRSGCSLHGREDYQSMLQAVMEQKAGIICVRELSRLVRDNQDWNQLVRLCRFQGVLLADEYRIYDPADPQDRVVLGIQGAFSEFELAMICDRMQKSRVQKAERGELYEGFPPGYICRHAPDYEKHPDARVQRAVEQVFEAFEHAPSVSSVYRGLLEKRFQLPIVPHGKDWREVRWVTPKYDQVLEMLRNPAYAGIYVRGRKKTITVLDDDGHLEKKRVRVSREGWGVFLEDHHEPYISRATWEKNLTKICANALMRRTMTKRSPQNGSGLMTGLLRCRRCGHKLHARYHNGRVCYVCRGGRAQRDSGGKPCFGFRGTRADEQLTELIFEVISPAAVAAANTAEKQLADRRQRERQLIVDRLEASRESEARAAREYKLTDATYTAVRDRLGREWEDALRVVHSEQDQLAEFDSRQPALLAAEQIEKLNRLGGDVRRIWNHPRADLVLKKQIVRTVIEEIIVDIDDSRDEVVLTVHWAGGHHTPLRVPRRRARSPARVRDLAAVVDTLRKVLDDSAIATALNRGNIKTLAGETWTGRRVAAFRKQSSIPAYSATTQEANGWITQAQAATSLNISPMSVARLVRAGIIPAEQPHPCLPCVMTRDALQLDRVKNTVRELKNSRNRPLSHDPNQLSLYGTIDS